MTPPNHIELEVVETDPGLKGDTAQGGSKPATLSTGAVVNVPLFIEISEAVLTHGLAITSHVRQKNEVGPRPRRPFRSSCQFTPGLFVEARQSLEVDVPDY